MVCQLLRYNLPEKENPFIGIENPKMDDEPSCIQRVRDGRDADLVIEFLIVAVRETHAGYRRREIRVDQRCKPVLV